MPIYEYICGGCGRKVELLVASSKVKVACPHCNSRRLVRQFSIFAAHQGSSSQSPCTQGRCPTGSRNLSCASGKCPFA